MYALKYIISTLGLLLGIDFCLSLGTKKIFRCKFLYSYLLFIIIYWLY